MTRRLVEEYARVEPWKVDHDRAMICLDFEDSLKTATALFRRIADHDAEWQAALKGATEELIDTYIKEVDSLYRTWLDASRKWVAFGERLARDGFDVAGLDDFRPVVEEAEAIVAGHEIDALLPPLEELEAVARPENPRPDRYKD
jgi:hypothetical protein